MSTRPPALTRVAEIGSYRCGAGEPLLLIAGPCVLQSPDQATMIAETLQREASARHIQLVFKASFDKANRTSLQAFRGPGMDAGLRILDEIRQSVRVPVTTDIHLPEQAEPVAQVCELLQIPAFLCRQTDLIVQAAKTGRAVNVKKGQFLAPQDMRYVVEKLRLHGCRNALLCERGTFFGYGRLVNDMQAIPLMQELGVPVIFDATHSVQQPGGLGGATGGNRAMVAPLTQAAVAMGADGLFLETHPDPDQSPSDGPNMIPLAKIPHLLDRLVAIREACMA